MFHKECDALKNWVKAFRLRTLPLALSGWLVGVSLSVSYGEIDWPVAGLTLLTAFLLQILSNLANDLGDAASGVDEQRQGEQRMVSAGLISHAAMKRAVVICSLVTLASGVSLLYLAFTDNLLVASLFLLLGVGGITAAIKYTVGKNPYGYAGFGDLFVLIFFGVVLVYGTFFMQVKVWEWLPLLPSFSVGLFAVAVLNVNNIRDIDSDKRSGKQSIPVRIGKESAVWYHIVLLFSGLVATTVFLLLKGSAWYDFVFLIIAFPFYRNIQAVRSRTGHDLDPYLKQMAISSLVFSVLFSAAQLAVSSF